MFVSSSIAGLACFVTLIFSCITLGQLVIFLSSHTYLQYPNLKYGAVAMRHKYYDYYQTPKDKESYVEDEFKEMMDKEMLYSVLCNLGLLCIFALQHSFQKKQIVKDFLTRKGLNVLERLLYICGSCLALQILMYYWTPIHSWTLWEISTSEHVVLWWVFTITHFITWLTIYSASTIMDISELIGAKQVYHHIENWPHPFFQKSEGLLRFYSHMRHPCFSALTLIFYFHPIMQLDRLILGNVLAVYMIIGFKVDDVDYGYQRRMLQRKYRELDMRS